MKLFSSVNDVPDVQLLVKEALRLKQNPYAHKDLGENKTIALVFLNPSLRTRMSTQKAALNLGMNVMVLNMDKEGWALELRDNVIMNGTAVEHIREAAAVMGQYADIIAVRSFPGLKDRDEDYNEVIFNKFVEFCGVPVVSLESATRHPLQSLADLITITELKKRDRPKVVLTWAPHIKPLPQAVPNSFAEWMCRADVEFTIANPEGYELCGDFTKGAIITHNQHEALADADFIYVKNWSAYEPYGKVSPVSEDWMLTNERLKITNDAKIMHCLPVRRDLELSSEILNGSSSIVVHEAGNRVWAAQAVLKRMLEGLG
ncbi:acetylornithine carbamoyltransferase [Mucilaginibacter sp. L3T2-6]|uniref:acetylornithine carbamoyltransferase n=1 Tax=Mucilaginibacter sp. L3T2-6 TaxID=3062491 RepID=UPI002676DD3C|nr:acetylornithine carbamoyltransferase [Mucilaginibacter sp. L3T2-6]MDO3644000.1 acetylornithine carbamoyltransferase [Mucilaginibacter sp. L3T2-6]MDV6216451.1 acetylornithine carbamoyltransferase [Mucilaginibacter sp. L3T2-6]